MCLVTHRPRQHSNLIKPREPGLCTTTHCVVSNHHRPREHSNHENQACVPPHIVLCLVTHRPRQHSNLIKPREPGLCTTTHCVVSNHHRPREHSNHENQACVPPHIVLCLVTHRPRQHSNLIKPREPGLCTTTHCVVSNHHRQRQHSNLIKPREPGLCTTTHCVVSNHHRPREHSNHENQACVPPHIVLCLVTHRPRQHSNLIKPREPGLCTTTHCVVSNHHRPREHSNHENQACVPPHIVLCLVTHRPRQHSNLIKPREPGLCVPARLSYFENIYERYMIYTVLGGQEGRTYFI